MGPPECHPGAGAHLSRLPGSARDALDGLGLSFPPQPTCAGAAVPLRRSLLFLIVERLDRIGAIFSYFKKETEQCNTKS